MQIDHSSVCTADIPDSALLQSAFYGNRIRKKKLQKPYDGLLGCACTHIVFFFFWIPLCLLDNSTWVNVIREDNELKEHVNSDVIHNLAFPEWTRTAWWRINMSELVQAAISFATRGWFWLLRKTKYSIYICVLSKLSNSFTGPPFLQANGKYQWSTRWKPLRGLTNGFHRLTVACKI